MYKKLSKPLFYLLSFTWGAPMTLFGCLVAAILLVVKEFGLL